MENTRNIIEAELRAITGIVAKVPIEALYLDLRKHQVPQEEDRFNFENDPTMSLEAALAQAPTIIEE